MNLRPHKTLEKDGVLALELTQGEFSGIIFSYGKVSFDENSQQDNLKVNFQYEVHDAKGLAYDKDEFEKELGDFLMELIVWGTEQNNIVYTGGTDEN
jgi:hypothetical protein